MTELAEVGEWKTYTLDLVSMAEDVRNSEILMPSGSPALIKDVWQFDVGDLYLWSTDACVEGFDYNSQFSVDYLKVWFTISTSGWPGGGGCPYTSVWNGTSYVLDNNLIPTAERSNGTDVIDYYKLRQPLVRDRGKCPILIWDLDKHSFLDHVEL